MVHFFASGQTSHGPSNLSVHTGAETPGSVHQLPFSKPFNYTRWAREVVNVL